MWLDADDVLSSESQKKFREMKKNLSSEVDVIMMPYDTAFDASGRTIFRYDRERIVKNHKGFRFMGRVHEVIPPKGKIYFSDIPVEHRKIAEGGAGDRNLNIYREMEEKGEFFESRALYYYGREMCIRDRNIRQERIWNREPLLPITGLRMLSLGSWQKGDNVCIRSQKKI